MGGRLKHGVGYEQMSASKFFRRYAAYLAADVFESCFAQRQPECQALKIELSIICNARNAWRSECASLEEENSKEAEQTWWTDARGLLCFVFFTMLFT